MKSRWILNNPSPDSPIIASTIIASWWPSRYYLALTQMIDGSDSLSRMVGLFRLGGKFDDSDGMKYITQVFKSNRYGIVGRNEYPLYETQHNSLSEAILGHKATIELISSRNLF